MVSNGVSEPVATTRSGGEAPRQPRGGNAAVPAGRPGLASLPIFQNAFRPFFLGGAVWAAATLILWLATLAGRLALPTAFDPLAWHQHEMLFGYAAAIIAGFALTAVPNWTGRLPIQGVRLAGLFALWLAGRAAVQVSLWTEPLPALLLDVGFLAVLAAMVLREIRLGSNWRNLPVAVLLGVLALANLLMHLEAAFEVGTSGIGIRLGLATVLTLIGLIGGRVTPSFTRNWLAKQAGTVLPTPFDRLDKTALVFLVLALACWVAAPDAALTGSMLAIAGTLQAVRLARWQGARTFREPLVLILHLGYGWLAAGLVLLGLDVLDLLPIPLAALHALTAGAIGTMTLAVMTRASLGHTGRALTAGPITMTIYAAVTAGALLRVAAPASSSQAVLLLGSLLWAAAFLLFAFAYAPMLMRQRAAGSS